MFRSATDKFISKANVHFRPLGKYRSWGSSANPQLATPWVSVFVLWDMPVIAPVTVTPRLGHWHCDHKAQSYLGCSCCATAAYGKGLQKVLGKMRTVACGEHHGKAVLDLGCDVRQWPLQLVLSVNRPLSFARKERKPCLVCRGTEPVLPHPGLSLQLGGLTAPRCLTHVASNSCSSILLHTGRFDQLDFVPCKWVAGK